MAEEEEDLLVLTEGGGGGLQGYLFISQCVHHATQQLLYS